MLNAMIVQLKDKENANEILNNEYAISVTDNP